MFDRWQCWWPKTWAYRIFKKHHTQLNAFYWVHRSSSNHLLKVAKNQSDGTLASSVFPLLPDDERRQSLHIAQWIGDYKEFMNWVRLSAVVSLASYLEIYLRSVVSKALESDPSLLLGVSRSVDGLKLLKARKDYSYADYSTRVVKGTWQDRANAYQEYFGRIPDSLQSSIGELDKLRTFRNGVGHAFGRAIDDYKSGFVFDVVPLQRLSEERLKKWLGIVESVALAIDEHLRTEHIGNYEVLSYFHVWQRGKLADAGSFKEHLHANIGNAPNKQYIKELISYYRRA